MSRLLYWHRRMQLFVSLEVKPVSCLKMRFGFKAAFLTGSHCSVSLSRWPSQELLPPIRAAPSHPGPDLVSHIARKLLLAHNVYFRILNITWRCSFTVIGVKAYSHLCFSIISLFYLLYPLKGFGWYEQRRSNGHPRVLYRHETHQTETPGSPSAPHASSQYETTSAALTPTVWLW